MRIIDAIITNTIPLPVSVCLPSQKSHRYHAYNFKSHSIVNAGTQGKNGTQNEMWFVTEPKVFQCIGVWVLATGSKAYLQNSMGHAAM